jgi:hypothetical protein
MEISTHPFGMVLELVVMEPSGLTFNLFLNLYTFITDSAGMDMHCFILKNKHLNFENASHRTWSESEMYEFQ